jgi:hypothetical protein
MPFHNPVEKSLLESEHLIGMSKTSVYLIYEDRQPGLWWQKFLKKGYKHVFAVRYDGFFWIKMDLTIGYLDIEVLPIHDRATISTVLKGQNVNYQYVEAWRKPRYRSIFAPWSCVEAMKAMLGIRAWWVLTPYQLYKYCEVNHGKKGARAN